MALKIRFRMPTHRAGWGSWLLRAVLIIVAAVAVFVLSVGGYLYFKYGSMVDARLQHPLFANTVKIMAEERAVRPGQKLTVRLIADELRQAGYSTEGAAKDAPLGTYRQEAGDRYPAVHPWPRPRWSSRPGAVHRLSGAPSSSAPDALRALRP